MTGRIRQETAEADRPPTRSTVAAPVLLCLFSAVGQVGATTRRQRALSGHAAPARS